MWRKCGAGGRVRAEVVRPVKRWWSRWEVREVAWSE